MKRRAVFAPVLLLATVVAASGLSGCAALNTVHADLSTWGDWPTGRAPGSYAFDRLPSQQSDPAEADRVDSSACPGEDFGAVATASGSIDLVKVVIDGYTFSPIFPGLTRLGAVTFDPIGVTMRQLY